MRTYYFGLAALSWFVHPYLLMALTVAVVLVVYRREFRSRTLETITARLPGPPEPARGPSPSPPPQTPPGEPAGPSESDLRPCSIASHQAPSDGRPAAIRFSSVSSGTSRM